MHNYLVSIRYILFNFRGISSLVLWGISCLIVTLAVKSLDSRVTYALLCRKSFFRNSGHRWRSNFLCEFYACLDHEELSFFDLFKYDASQDAFVHTLASWLGYSWLSVLPLEPKNNMHLRPDRGFWTQLISSGVQLWPIFEITEYTLRPITNFRPTISILRHLGFLVFSYTHT